MGYILITWLEWFLFPFLCVSPNIQSILGNKYLEGILPAALASLIEGHWCTDILLLLVIGFNPSIFYVLLHIALAYGDIYISPYLAYRIRAYVRLLILICFF